MNVRNEKERTTQFVSHLKSLANMQMEIWPSIWFVLCFSCSTSKRDNWNLIDSSHPLIQETFNENGEFVYFTEMTVMTNDDRCDINMGLPFMRNCRKEKKKKYLIEGSYYFEKLCTQRFSCILGTSFIMISSNYQFAYRQNDVQKVLSLS